MPNLPEVKTSAEQLHTLNENKNWETSFEFIYEKPSSSLSIILKLRRLFKKIELPKIISFDCFKEAWMVKKERASSENQCQTVFEDIKNYQKFCASCCLFVRKENKVIRKKRKFNLKMRKLRKNVPGIGLIKFFWITLGLRFLNSDLINICQQ